MIGIVDDMMTIGDFSSRCGLSPKVLRTYAEAGVLVPAAVDPTSGYRYYDPGQLEQAEIVRLLRRAGVGLADIGQFLAEPSADAVDGWECSLTVETLSRREALAEVRCRLGVGPERTRGATAIEVRSVRNVADLRAAFDLAGAQLPEPIDSGDDRIDDLVEHFQADEPLMVVATADSAVGGALAFRNGNGTVTLRIIGVIPSFRHRGIGRRLVERVEAEARRLGAHSVALGTDEAVGFWYHLGYTPNLLFQWVYDAGLYQEETDAMLTGPLAGLHFWAVVLQRHSPAVRRARRASTRPASPGPRGSHRLPRRLHDVQEVHRPAMTGRKITRITGDSGHSYWPGSSPLWDGHPNLECPLTLFHRRFRRGGASLASHPTHKGRTRA
jgi:DNA-binding transcriptional MerR regulator